MSERMGLLKAGAAQLSVALSEEQLDQFETYFQELADWNQRANLTAIIEYEDVQVKHFLDSLTICLTAREHLAGPVRVMDVGAGAGLPGLALKLAFPDIKLALVESAKKKAAFLHHIVEKLGLEDVSIYTGRAEELAREKDLRDAFDLVAVRSLAKLPLLLEFSLPFCKPGGRLVALKHGGDWSEQESAANALSELGGHIEKVSTVLLEGLTDDRIVISIVKTGPTPSRYPRAVGIPGKRPL
ncbi:MAG TPA: 16S rRNA (guanine(527)-N(7))-methyltransferase RsmG [Dehalococcoidia bacterium]|nr:16S rRNA (guanine(527)-N(7))-methyltransferase RsmG [Dehalococcoidia bacterium]HIN25196.1 16S rRNA (guanine(527)-N(7))-methyltransferase RsmG [Dehalococcoidia bacterium]